MSNKLKHQEIMEILLENGYKRTNIVNQFTTKDKVAVVSKSGDVYITSYTPVHKRFLDCKVVSQNDLDNYLKN